jgi:hypothetical protein
MTSYVIHAVIPGTGDVYRRIEILGRQTLNDLHDAIQLAFSFDHAHFYSFFMSNHAWDKFSEYAIPDGYDPYGNPLYSMEIDGGRPRETRQTPNVDWNDPDAILHHHYDGDAAKIANFKASRGDRWTMATRWVAAQYQTPGNALITTIDSLNLSDQQQFLYLFDYTIEWRFQLRVVGINREPCRTCSFPRIVASEGAAPRQYSEWEQGRDYFRGR